MSMEIDKIVELVKKKLELYSEKKIPVEASGRHIHLSVEDAEILFGKDYQFNILKELSQPNQYACKERVRLIGPKGIIEDTIILGPCRGKSQVEISMTDARTLGVKGVIRESGDILNTPGVIITNGDKFVVLKEGVIVAKNHIHMTNEDALMLNVRDKDLIKIKIYSQRPLIFEDVLVRVNDNFKLSMHIDYDEANACGLEKDSYGVIYG